MDFCQYKGRDYISMVDQLTGFIQCEQTTNQSTSSAILCVINWDNKYGYPYKIMSDNGVSHTPSSTYHPEANSKAERAVISLKNT